MGWRRINFFPVPRFPKLYYAALTPIINYCNNCIRYINKTLDKWKVSVKTEEQRVGN